MTVGEDCIFFFYSILSTSINDFFIHKKETFYTHHLHLFCICKYVANLAVVVAAYGFAFAFANDDEDDDEEGSKGPAWLKFIYKSLDFGSGRERGARN